MKKNNILVEPKRPTKPKMPVKPEQIEKENFEFSICNNYCYCEYDAKSSKTGDSLPFMC